MAIAIWIAIDPLYPGLSRLTGGTAPVPFDPGTLASIPWRWTFIVFRVMGAVLVVPVMEELFWRGFLIRWLVRDDFKGVPIGTFTGYSFGVTVLLFGAEHEQWLAGIICGALYNILALPDQEPHRLRRGSRDEQRTARRMGSPPRRLEALVEAI